ncbi:hypothetical protein PG999_005722 [Apiospora kogelbergensis]|uniref:Uncharacterized protein n=1 Tax=Apiospora kogelbergensis TaxID=1337665 RepID=A0AAW0QPA5_9PEZI
MVDDNAPTFAAAEHPPRSPGHAPPGHGIRRAVTVDEPAHLRRRPTANSPTADPFGDIRRRSSNFSDFSLNDARHSFGHNMEGIWTPDKEKKQSDERTRYALIPLVLALLPAVGGILFQNGSAFLTDIILLGLAAIFLHWSVTQPWDWYRAAQEIRLLKDASMDERVFETDTEVEPSVTDSVTTALENVPEGDEKDRDEVEDQTPGDRPTSSAQLEFESRQESASQELYTHEVLALAGCFIFPLLGALLLHAIRCQLTRGSEGLVSNYNLCIFLIAAEVRPVSHMFKLLQDRVLRMQRLVSTNPHLAKTQRDQQIEDLYGRLEELDLRAAAAAAAAEVSSPPSVQTETSDNNRAMEALVAGYMRDNTQPELDALNRAVRRYEKKLALLANATDRRVEYLEQKMNDAIALAAVAAKNSTSQADLSHWLAERMVAMIAFPIQTAMAVCGAPFRAFSSLFGQKGRLAPEKSHRTGRRPGSAKVNGEYVSSRSRR